VLEDQHLIEVARRDARALISSDPHLGTPQNRPLLREVHRTYEAAWAWIGSG
jgi:hypothetical protein